MKTTVEIADDLMLRARAVVQKEKSTFREFLDAALRTALDQRQAAESDAIDISKAVFRGGRGMRSELEGANWDQIRDLIYDESTES